MLNTNILKFCLLLLLIVLSAAASTCGTNCPSNTCTNCICGNLRTIIVPEGFCKNFSWNKDCCKCIAEKVSAMNGHFMQQSMGGLQIGIMGIFDTYSTQCGSTPAGLCNWQDNAKCAYKEYVDYGSDWTYWGPEAAACGCPHRTKPWDELTEEQKRHIERIYPKQQLSQQ